jgi:hypothetical protein
VAIVLSIIVVVVGFPVFQREKGFPASLIWTFAVVLGVWLTYLIRAYLWSAGEDKKDPSLREKN